MKLLRKLFLLLIIVLLVIVCIKSKIYLNAVDFFNQVLDNNSIEIKLGDFFEDDSDDESVDNSNIYESTGEFNEVFYPYYGMLNTNQQSLYKQIYENALNVDDSFVPSASVTVDELKDTFEAVYNDHPELFWVDIITYSYQYSDDGYCTQVGLYYYDIVNDLDKSKDLFESYASKIISEANKLDSNYDKEKYIHDAVIELVEYDENASMTQSAYSALVNHKSVCAGYAKTFQYLMTRIGIPTYYVTGTSEGNHAWNIVMLDDEYYNVDLTWDDQKRIIYDYFNVSDAVFNKTHTRSDLSKLLPSCNGS